MKTMFPAAAAVAVLFAAGIPAAHAQSGSDSLLRNQSRVINQAVGTQARQGTKPQAGGSTATVAARAVNLRAQPGQAAPVIGVLPQGTQLTVTGPAEGTWTPVEHQGRTGYVVTSLLTPDR
ncbi:SH3 domain-containing protein [Azospirillum endophyticum]